MKLLGTSDCEKRYYIVGLSEAECIALFEVAHAADGMEHLPWARAHLIDDFREVDISHALKAIRSWARARIKITDLQRAVEQIVREIEDEGE